MAEEFASAKINLCLAITGRRKDGYHLLQSLVTFADVGDRLNFQPDRPLSLTVSGPCGQGLDMSDNLVLKAARALRLAVPDVGEGAFHLEKVLPVAAGIGGGSADAAAALRLLARHSSLTLDDPRVTDVARQIGADVPVCLNGQSCIMRGAGEELSDPLALPTLPAVLVNPNQPLSTREVFTALGGRFSDPPLWDEAVIGRACHAGQIEALYALLEQMGNDLQPPACRLQPVIGEVLAAITQTGCRIARMSGSGATCFGLYATEHHAAQAEEMLQARSPHWWVRKTLLGKQG